MCLSAFHFLFFASLWQKYLKVMILNVFYLSPIINFLWLRALTFVWDLSSIIFNGMRKKKSLKMKKTLIGHFRVAMQMKLINTRTFLNLASFWKRQFLNSEIAYYPLCGPVKASTSQQTRASSAKEVTGLQEINVLPWYQDVQYSACASRLALQ